MLHAESTVLVALASAPEPLETAPVRSETRPRLRDGTRHPMWSVSWRNGSKANEASESGMVGVMRDVYACRLPVEGPGAASYKRLLGLVRSRVAKGVEMDGRVGRFERASGPVRWSLLGDDDEDHDRLFMLSQDQVGDGPAGLRRCTSFGVSLQSGRASLFVRVALEPADGRVLPVRFEIDPPAIIGEVLDGFEVAEDGWQLTREPAYACDRGGAAELAKLILLPTRLLPVVVLTPGSKGYHVDPDELAAGLVGLAHVTVLDSPVVSSDLIELLGSRLGVYGGSLRVYWPGAEPESDPRGHPSWGPPALTDPRLRPFVRVLRHVLVPAASLRANTAPLEEQLRLAAEQARAAEIDALLLRARTASLKADWAEELERAWREIEEQRAVIADLRGQLRTERENVRALVAHAPAIEDAAPADEPRFEEPSSVGEAVAWAREQCPHLVILDDAVDSARRATYRQPGRFWRALLAMEEVAAAWEANELGAPLADAFADRGFEYRVNVSLVAVGRRRREYERTYQGATITLGPHLALGRGSPEACARIYWYQDKERKVFVVGHAGNHLPDSTTG